MIIKRLVFILMVIALALPSTASCLEATAQVDKTTISSEDSVFFKVVVSGGKADLDFSGVKDFKVISNGREERPLNSGGCFKSNC